MGAFDQDYTLEGAIKRNRELYAADPINRLKAQGWTVKGNLTAQPTGAGGMGTFSEEWLESPDGTEKIPLKSAADEAALYRAEHPVQDASENFLNDLMFTGAGITRAAANGAIRLFGDGLKNTLPKLSFQSAYGATHPVAAAVGDAALSVGTTVPTLLDINDNGFNFSNSVGLGLSLLPIAGGVYNGVRNFGSLSGRFVKSFKTSSTPKATSQATPNVYTSAEDVQATMANSSVQERAIDPTILNNPLSYPRGKITGMLPGHRLYTIEKNPETGKYKVYYNSLSIGDEANKGLLANELTSDEVNSLLQSEYNSFNESATDFQKLVYDNYYKLPRVKIENANDHLNQNWTNWDELSDKTPDELRQFMTNILNKEFDMYESNEYMKRFYDLAEELGLPERYYGYDHIDDLYETLKTDFITFNEPMVYKAPNSNGGISKYTPLTKQWGVNAYKFNNNDQLQSTAGHEIAHLVYANDYNGVRPMILDWIHKEGGLAKYLLPEIQNYSSNFQKYLSDPNEFHSRIMEGVRLMLQQGKSAEEVFNSKLFLNTKLPKVYDKDFLIKCLNKFIVGTGLVAGGAKAISNGEKESSNK